MKTKLHYVLSMTMFLFVFSALSQTTEWKPIENYKNAVDLSPFNINPKAAKLFQVDIKALTNKMSSSKKSSISANNQTLTLPNQDGTFEVYQIKESSVFSPPLAKKFPNIKSFVGYSISNPSKRLRLSFSPNGIQTMVSNVGKPYQFMRPIERGSNTYVLYSRKEHLESSSYLCKTAHELSKTKKVTDSKVDEGGANDGKLHTFKIAISVTGEYTAYFGGTTAGALGGINASLNRINEIFETDMAISFQLVDATELIFLNPETDPYSDADVGVEGAWSSELQNTLTTTIGDGAYDVGHLFGASGGGGNAGCIGCVCTDGIKGSGYTSPSNDVPEGDEFDLNFAIHEIGHQMGANHTWAFEDEGTNVQSEPGSGSTIMAYAGITDEDNIQIGSDPYFHYQSIKQILDNIANKTCQTISDISNQVPVADAGIDYNIPANTPYVLKGSASDADSQGNLTYCWEQVDTGIVNSSNFGSSITRGSINRSLPPTNESERYIPNLKSVLNGQLTESNPNVGSEWESVSSVSRNLSWALTVRDRTPQSNNKNGQTSYDTMNVTVDDNAGPFIVTSQSEKGLNLIPGTSSTITWNVANTNTGIINTANVRILLSTDGGQSFSTILIESTANDGSEDFVVPALSAPFCRIKVEAIDNIYYAVNSEDFAINYTVLETCENPYNSALNLGLNFDENTPVNHSINVPDNGTISDIKLSVNISHSFVNDVIIKLTHPNGQSAATIWERNCLDQSNIVATFENWSANVDCANTGTENTFRPVELLDVFEGLDAAGNWTISVSDVVPQDDGTLNSWGLEICTQTSTVDNPDIEDKIDGVLAYPNPTEGDLTVAFNSNSGINISIIVSDIRGRVVLEEIYRPSVVFTEKLNLNGLQTGMYVLEISDGSFSTIKKIIVK